MKTRAALFHGAGRPFEVAEVELEEPRANEVLVRMAAVGICGTDLHVVRGEWERPLPIVVGHEGIGVVEAVGAAVTRVGPGQRVVLSWAPSCGDCADCARGRPATCTRLHRAMSLGTMVDGRTGMSRGGETVYRDTATGALSEYLVVAERVALPIGDDVPLQEAALLGCAALTGTGAALFAARVGPGSSVVVIGAGGVGQFVVQGSRIAGASRIVSVDPVEARRDVALGVGATHAVAPEGLRDLIRAELGDGADYAFDAVGEPETTAAALRAARPGGMAVVVGLPSGPKKLELDPVEFWRREKTLTGTIYGSEDPAVSMPIMVEHVRAGRLDLRSQVGPTFTLDEVNEAFAASMGGAGGRVVVTL